LESVKMSSIYCKYSRLLSFLRSFWNPARILDASSLLRPLRLSSRILMSPELEVDSRPPDNLPPSMLSPFILSFSMASVLTEISPFACLMASFFCSSECLKSVSELSLTFLARYFEVSTLSGIEAFLPVSGESNSSSE